MESLASATTGNRRWTAINGLDSQSKPARARLPPAIARSAAFVHRLDARRIGVLATACIVLAAYLLSQADQGIQGDAHIYMGRALADLDPLGVGRDLLFVDDGQSRFSVFRLVARLGVRCFGLATTARLLGVAASLAWLAAMLSLVWALRPRRALALVAAAGLLLPRWYAPWNGMGAGEALAVPRPFAEAAVLLALALLARGRIVGCGLLLCLAGLLHPIMALPGFAVLLLALIASDRRWALAAAGLAVAIIGAGALGAPVLDRLLVAIDPTWLAILRERSPTLFVTAWPMDAYAAILLQLATILMASTLVEGAMRLLLRGAAAVAVAGFLLSAVFCDGLHLLLFAQAQLWRSLWLGAALAPLAAGVCAWRLPALGARGRVTLAALVAAWACFQLQPVGAVLALLAAFLLAAEGSSLTPPCRHAVYALAGSATLFAVLLGIEVLMDDRATVTGSLLPVWHSAPWSLAVISLAALGTLRSSRAFAAAAALLLVPMLVILAYRHDERSALTIDLDAGRPKADLVALLSSRPGEVLWLGGDELWYWTRRASWNTSLQGAGIVFSRDLALLWHDRATALVSHGLASRAYLSPWAQGVVHHPLAYDRPVLDDLCRRSDAPAWVVMPIAETQQVQRDAGVQVWTSPLEDTPADGASGAAPRVAKRHLVIPCRSL